ncbi:hypothetical protein ACFVWG_20650 [Kribbella sp. NPDC058245]|uniref:hypothetical protein n=1 Tax=Kribbella sp. NPDC058245 TaxID=3346399 RepID=UPI0036E31D91
MPQGVGAAPGELERLVALRSAISRIERSLFEAVASDAVGQLLPRSVVGFALQVGCRDADASFRTRRFADNRQVQAGRRSGRGIAEQAQDPAGVSATMRIVRQNGDEGGE